MPDAFGNPCYHSKLDIYHEDRGPSLTARLCFYQTSGRQRQETTVEALVYQDKLAACLLARQDSKTSWVSSGYNTLMA